MATNHCVRRCIQMPSYLPLALPVCLSVCLSCAKDQEVGTGGMDGQMNGWDNWSAQPGTEDERYGTRAARRQERP